jgi:hypothetical protein
MKTKTTTCGCTECECSAKATEIDENSGIDLCSACAEYECDEDGGVSCLRGRLQDALGRRLLRVTVAVNVATVTVRANPDADDCLGEARKAVGAILDGASGTRWADETRDAVVVEAWL